MWDSDDEGPDDDLDYGRSQEELLQKVTRVSMRRASVFAGLDCRINGALSFSNSKSDQLHEPH